MDVVFKDDSVYVGFVLVSGGHRCPIEVTAVSGKSRLEMFKMALGEALSNLEYQVNLGQICVDNEEGGESWEKMGPDWTIESPNREKE